jgi:hypothetical protein
LKGSTLADPAKWARKYSPYSASREADANGGTALGSSTGKRSRNVRDVTNAEKSDISLEIADQTRLT